MSDLQTTIQNLAADLAANILNAVRSASLEEIGGMLGGGASVKTSRIAASAEPKAAKPGRKSGKGSGVKRSPEVIEQIIGEVVANLKSNPDGIGSEHLQKALSIEKKDIVGPITQALAQGLIKKSGQKRATRYFPGTGARAATKTAKPAAAKKVKKAASKKAAKPAKAKVKAATKTAAKPKKRSAKKASSKSANGIAGAATPAASSPDVGAEA